MNIKVTKELYNAVGSDQWEEFGIDDDEGFSYRKFVEIDLSLLSAKKLDLLRSRMQTHSKIRGVPTALYDIDTWLKVLNNTTSQKPRTVSQFSSMLTQKLLRVPGHRIYLKDSKRDVWYPYYAQRVEYHPPRQHRDGGSSPPYVTVNLNYQEFNNDHEVVISFHASECVGVSVEEALLQKNFSFENEELRTDYLRQKKTYFEWSGQVGKQFWARGIGTDDLDGNYPDDDDHFRHRDTSVIALERDGVPSQVVIDVFEETDKEGTNISRSRNFDRWFWSKKTNSLKDTDEDSEEEELSPEDVEMEITREEIEIPIHCTVACFDLRKHLRVRVHVDQLTEYVYDQKLGEKLILPPTSRALVELLLEHRAGFRDIIANKGNGAVILCAGSPGTGKTLTAEVFSEVEQRPLYTIQCSQLGINPEELETSLLKSFKRAQRWNAILLLDEADVYVAARGSNLIQNAIVGVFLRTLEYYSGVLFLTTNRADLVDDAILSRCIAKIEYKVPASEDQEKIWKILAETAGVKLDQETIQDIVDEYYNLSGRDIKNLLKLAALVSAAEEQPITLKTIEFVKQFKPTADIEEDQ